MFAAIDPVRDERLKAKSSQTAHHPKWHPRLVRGTEYTCEFDICNGEGWRGAERLARRILDVVHMSWTDRVKGEQYVNEASGVEDTT